MGRKKLREDRKRKKISTTIEDDLWQQLGAYAEKIGESRSTILEQWIKAGLNDPRVVADLKKDGLILPESTL